MTSRRIISGSVAPQRVNRARPHGSDAGVRLADDEIRLLGERRWFLRDGAMGVGTARALRSAAEQKQARGELRPAGVGRGGDHRLQANIRSDLIGWVERTEPGFTDAFVLFDALLDGLNRDAFLGLERYDVQLGFYAEGAAYSRHRDAFRGGANRRVTAILYLNEGWTPERGGLLVLHRGGAKEIAPLLDRLVVFLSEEIEHEVTASRAPRFALTAWFYGRAH